MKAQLPPLFKYDLEAGNREEQIQASLAAKLLEWAEPLLVHEEDLIKARVYAILQAGDKLDPQLAVQEWASLQGIQRLRSLLERKIRKGERLAKESPLTL